MKESETPVRRGDIWWVNFEPAVGGEIRKTRPAIVVSIDASNKHLNRVQVVPLTSSVGKVYPSEALLTVKGKPNKAKADQLATISKSRLRSRFGRATPTQMQRIERAMRIQLGLGPSP
jgi:mRNA interferase MazF